MVAKLGISFADVCWNSLDEFNVHEPDVDQPFRPLGGHLMWLANNARPDFLNAVRAVARYSHAPKRVHWNAACGTTSLGITFPRSRVLVLRSSCMLTRTPRAGQGAGVSFLVLFLRSVRGVNGAAGRHALLDEG